MIRSRLITVLSAMLMAATFAWTKEKTLVNAEPELAGSVTAILPFHFGSSRSAQVFGPSSACTSLVFCRTTIRCTLVPIQRSCGSRNSAATASLFFAA